MEVLQTFFALTLKASPPEIELITRNPEEPAGQTDVVADLLVVLKHSKPHLGFADLLLLGDHGGPPRWGGKSTSTVRHLY
jgi:hypothetical protein